MEFEPFNSAATCPKCSSDNIATEFRRDTHGYPCRLYNTSQDCLAVARSRPECCHFEHMHRWCVRCQFGWVELPQDVPWPVPAPSTSQGAGDE